MGPRPRPISSEAQLLVEGNDADAFFEAMIRHLSLENLQVQNFGGVTELRTFLSAFVKLSDFSGVKSIGIIRDAEDSALGAFESVRGSLERAELTVPDAIGKLTGDRPAVSVMILPGPNRTGMLETLLWDTIRDDEVRVCIDAFFDCVEELHGEALHRPHKSRARAFLATKHDPHLSVGNAAKRGYWDLDHLALGPVRTFLREIVASH